MTPRAMRKLVESIRQADSLAQQLHLLEAVAYTLQTGPEGGKFYFTKTGTKVYGLPPTGRLMGPPRPAAPSPKARQSKVKPPPPLSRENYVKTWHKYAKTSDVRLEPSAEVIAAELHGIFGDRSPSPKDFNTMFSAQGLDAKPTSILASPNYVRVNFRVDQENGEKIDRSFVRTFSKRGDGPHVHHDYLSLVDRYQGGGRAGAMFDKALKSYDKLGISKVSVYASLSAGPYVWARFGFQPESVYDAESISRDFSSFLTRQPSDPYSGLGMSEESAKVISDIVGKDIHRIAGMKIWGKRVVKNPDGSTSEEKVPMEIGKDFFLHSRRGFARDWSGEFDLSDPNARKRWLQQSKKGKKAREKAVAEGKGNDPTPEHELEKRREAHRKKVDRYQGKFEPEDLIIPTPPSKSSYYFGDRPK